MMPIRSELMEDSRRVADMAPSILNTKPWSLSPVDDDDRIELRADWTRRLRVIDPRHRELVISCGAALFNVRMAIRVTGHDLVYSLMPARQTSSDACPDPECRFPGLLASVEIASHRIHRATKSQRRLYEAIERRHTVREPFSPIEMNMIVTLERAARREGVYAVLLNEPEAKRLLEEAAEASQELAGDKSHREQLEEWTGGGPRVSVSPDYGVPADKFAPEPKSPRYPSLRRRASARAARPPVRDLGLTWHGTGGAKFEKHPTLIALGTKTDTPPDWMRMGLALQRLLLTATRYHVAASFLTQQLEVDDWKYKRTNEYWPSPKPEPQFSWPAGAWVQYGSTQMVIRLGYSSDPGDPGRGGR
jgi:hypothetical protein